MSIYKTTISIPDSLNTPALFFNTEYFSYDSLITSINDFQKNGQDLSIESSHSKAFSALSNWNRKELVNWLAGNQKELFYKTENMGEAQNWSLSFDQWSSYIDFFQRFYNLYKDKIGLIAHPFSVVGIKSILAGLNSASTVYFFEYENGYINDVSSEELGLWVEKFQLSVLHLSPTIFRSLALSCRDLSSVRLIILEGEPITIRDVCLFQKQFSEKAKLGICYSLPEYPIVSCQIFSQEELRETTTSATSVGTFFPHQTRLISQSGKISPICGEMEIQSEFSARKCEAHTSGAEKNGGVSNLPGWVSSGWLLRRRFDKTYDYIGLSENQFFLNHQWYHCEEVESKYLNHPDICQAVALHNPSPNLRLIVFYETISKRPVPEIELKELFPIQFAYNLEFSFVFLPSFPLNDIQAIDRKKLALLFERQSWPPVASQSFPETNDSYRKLQILMKALKNIFNVTEITADDDFFRLGGDSLLATQLKTHLASQGLLITFEDIILFPKINDLADRSQWE